ncbi:Hypothetical protein NTJ_00794 [Nesidiocoris tenuis]|uniref:Uncharacterized protein n=1 Tax=Nesidiocoris tenuis TaxID=355587 RepID=A0ABN7A6V7_9HEMI|nr:Hypothetical protein NTJ_00794 [Nesidiocoris tenuis]
MASFDQKFPMLVAYRRVYNAEDKIVAAMLGAGLEEYITAGFTMEDVSTPLHGNNSIGSIAKSIRNAQTTSDAVQVNVENRHRFSDSTSRSSASSAPTTPVYSYSYSYSSSAGSVFRAKHTRMLSHYSSPGAKKEAQLEQILQELYQMEKDLSLKKAP